MISVSIALLRLTLQIMSLGVTKIHNIYPIIKRQGHFVGSFHIAHQKLKNRWPKNGRDTHEWRLLYLLLLVGLR
jgi:hypothetical protein